MGGVHWQRGVVKVGGGKIEGAERVIPRWLKAPFYTRSSTTLTLVTHTYESRRAMTPNESCCEIPSPDSYESYRYLLNQSGAQSASPGETHDSEL